MAIRSTDLAPDIEKALSEKESKLLDESSSSTNASATVEVNGEKTSAEPEEPKKPLTPEEKRAEEVLLKYGAKKGATVEDKLWSTVIGAASCAGAYFLQPKVMFLAVLLYLFGAMMLLYGIFSSVKRGRKNSQKGETTVYPAEVLEALLPLLTLNPVEQRYGAVMTLLARDKSPLDEASRNRMIEQVNGLLEDSRALAAKREEIISTRNHVDIAAIEKERERLLEEARATDDPIIRNAKNQSAKLLADRIEDSRVVQNMATRMLAQEEAIFETMGTLHSSLTRLSVAPESLRHHDLDSMTEVVDSTRLQTQAVEQAVQEVAAIRTGG